MSRLLPEVINENQGLVDDNGEKQLESCVEHNANVDVNEGIASNDQGDDVGNEEDYDNFLDDYYNNYYDFGNEDENEEDYDPYEDHIPRCYNDDGRLSDNESFTSVKEVVEPVELQPIIGVDCLVRCNQSNKMNGDHENVGSTVDEVDSLQLKAGANGLVRLDENDHFHLTIKNRFISGMEDCGVHVQVEHIDRCCFNASDITRARLETFTISTNIVNEKTKGHANVRHAWFGASKDQINKILLHGFSHDNIVKDGAFGYGLYLSTDNAIFENVKSSISDDDGIRHILLCRVILGRVEAVKPDSKQCQPRSDEFQTGVDDLNFPTKVILWSTQINTHVLPEYMISFKTFSDPGIERSQNEGSAISPLMPSKVLVFGLSKVLPPESAKKIYEYHNKFAERKISRHDMFVGFRDVAGDWKLKMVVNEFKKRVELTITDEKQLI